MKSSCRIVVVVCLVAIASLAVASSAAAAVTSTQITSPSSPNFGIFDHQAPTTIAVSGVSDGAAGEEVDLDCFYGEGSPPIHRTLAAKMVLGAGGSFSIAAADLSQLENVVCHLRAVPTGAPPADLTPFSGPIMAIGERADTSGNNTITTGPNDGTPYAFYIRGQQLSAADDYNSIAGCGLTDAYLFDGTFEETATTFYCNDWFWSYENYQEKTKSTRSQIQVDGANAYLPFSAERINPSASPGFPAVSYSYSQNPLNGNLTITDSESIVRCPEATFPPTSTSCSSFLPTGVTDNRTIEQTNDGHLVTISDRFTSTDGQAHSLSLLSQNDQDFNESGENVAYRFPGQSVFGTREHGESVSFPEAPGTVYINVQGAPDGDTATGRAAIVFDRPSSPATFNEIGPEVNAFYFHQSVSVPAGGSTLVRFAYAQAYASNEVEALVQLAESSFKPTPIFVTTVPTPVVKKKRCHVPSLRGKKLKHAKKVLRKAHCKLGKVKKKKGATAKSGKVAEQRPKAGKVLAGGSKVTVTLKG